MEKITPTPRTLTLRFKHNRSTILLEVDPLQKLSDVRAELLQAVTETNPSGKLSGKDIPKNPDNIILGKAVDRNNLALGYTTIAKDDEGSEAPSGKGKGKGTATITSKAGAADLKDCPQGAGLRNADVVAFKFKNDLEAGEEDTEEKWDVVIPTMEETYGDEDMDEGLGMDEG